MTPEEQTRWRLAGGLKLRAGTVNDRHARVTVYDRGAAAGELTLDRDTWDQLPVVVEAQRFGVRAVRRGALGLKESDQEAHDLDRDDLGRRLENLLATMTPADQAQLVIEREDSVPDELRHLTAAGRQKLVEAGADPSTVDEQFRSGRFDGPAVTHTPEEMVAALADAQAWLPGSEARSTELERLRATLTSCAAYIALAHDHDVPGLRGTGP